MKLMPNEKLLRESKSRGLVLTTHRIRYQTQSLGSAHIKSIMLEELCSCAMYRNSNPIFLVLAALSVVISLMALMATVGVNTPAILFVGLLFGGIFVFLFFATRTQVLSFASAGLSIQVNTIGLTAEAVEEFIDAAEAAKNARYLLVK